MYTRVQEDKSKEYKVEDQYIKPLVVKPVKLKVGNKVTARSPRKEQLTREGGRPKSLSIGSRGTKSPMAKRRVGGGGDGDSDDEDEGAVGMTKSSSSSPAKYSSAAKEEPADETDGEGGKQEDEEKKNANEDQESKDLINSFKSMTGTYIYVCMRICMIIHLLCMYISNFTHTYVHTYTYIYSFSFNLLYGVHD